MKVEFIKQKQILDPLQKYSVYIGNIKVGVIYQAVEDKRFYIAWSPTSGWHRSRSEAMAPARGYRDFKQARKGFRKLLRGETGAR